MDEHRAVSPLLDAVAEVETELWRSRVDFAQGRARLIEHASRGRQAQQRRRVSKVSALLAAAALVALTVFWIRHPRPLTFTVAGRDVPVQGWIAAPPDAPLPLSFSDGSRVGVLPASRARVTDLYPDGARMVVERGKVDVAVLHRSSTRWQFVAGPYAIQVTGTRFQAGWDSDSETFEIRMQEGSVRVTGPMLDEGRSVTAGETLRVQARGHRLEVDRDEAAAAQPVPSAPLSWATASAPEPAESGSATPPAAVGSAGRASYRELVAQRRYQAAIEEAEREGFESVCETANAPDLAALATAARLGGKLVRATQALTALRSRYAGSGQAAVAAYQLGAMAFDQRAAYGEAARWFSTYLTEQPGGSLAREASGRLIEACQRASDASCARQAAIVYIGRYPNGPHSALARSIAGD